jgi:hypothetical protein
MKRIPALLLSIATVLALFSACGAKPKTAADWLSLGEKYLLDLDYDQAIATLDEAIKIEPKDPRYRVMKIIVYVLDDNTAGAQDEQQRAQDDDVPDFPALPPIPDRPDDLRPDEFFQPVIEWLDGRGLGEFVKKLLELLMQRWPDWRWFKEARDRLLNGQAVSILDIIKDNAFGEKDMDACPVAFSNNLTLDYRKWSSPSGDLPLDDIIYQIAETIDFPKVLVDRPMRWNAPDSRFLYINTWSTPHHWYYSFREYPAVGDLSSYKELAYLEASEDGRYYAFSSSSENIVWPRGLTVGMTGEEAAMTFYYDNDVLLKVLRQEVVLEDVPGLSAWEYERNTLYFYQTSNETGCYWRGFFDYYNETEGRPYGTLAYEFEQSYASGKNACKRYTMMISVDNNMVTNIGMMIEIPERATP